MLVGDAILAHGLPGSAESHPRIVPYSHRVLQVCLLPGSAAMGALLPRLLLVVFSYPYLPLQSSSAQPTNPQQQQSSTPSPLSP